MGLQLRVTDPLGGGDRVIDLDDRAADRPHLIGLDPRADVQVAAAPGVAPRHGFLFVHDGQWFVQDARTQAGTFRNGKPVTGPTPIFLGDVITLGRGDGAVELTVSGVNVGAAAQAPADEAGWPGIPAAPAAASRGSATYYIPKTRGVSPAALTVTVLLLIALLGGGGVFLYSAYQKREEALKPHIIVVETPPATTTATTRPVRIVRTTPPKPTSPGAATTEPAEPPQDPRKSEPDWLAVESARFEDPPIAIAKFYDYLERFPESPFKADVDRYIEEGVDRIWWQRLIELFEERDLATKQIDDRKGQLAVTGEGDFKKILETEIEEWQQRRTGADTIITKIMKYQGLGPPNPYDSASLAALRQQRDPAYYAMWKDDVLKTIKRSRGQRLPWRAAK